MKTRIMLQTEIFEAIKWKDRTHAYRLLFEHTKKTSFAELKYDQLAKIVPLIKEHYDAQTVPARIDGTDQE